MGETIKAKLGLNECRFQPPHKNNLSNEFRCFTSYSGGGTLGSAEEGASS